MGKEKIIIDTNCLISAFGWNGNERVLLRKVISGEYLLVVSEEQFQELERVLSYPKLKFSEQKQKKIIDIVKSISLVVKKNRTNSEKMLLLRDPDDNFLLECADASNADYIITGDKGVLELKQYGKTKILTTRELLEEKLRNQQKNS